MSLNKFRIRDQKRSGIARTTNTDSKTDVKFE